MEALLQDSRFSWIPDDFDYRKANLKKVSGHRQVTDVYLAELARYHDAKLASFDEGLAKLRSNLVTLIPKNA